MNPRGGSAGMPRSSDGRSVRPGLRRCAPLTPWRALETLRAPSSKERIVMVAVETVRGPVDLRSLGPTLMHEHVFVLSTEHVQNYGSSWWDEEARVADAITKLNALYAKGIHTIVDPTLWGLGRYI